MSNYNWCHNPNCHTYQTQSRVRGTGDNKVLRTRKVKIFELTEASNWYNPIWNYFCNQQCLFEFLKKFATEIANTYSVNKPSETPIRVDTEKYESHRYKWNGNEHTRVPYQATRKIIRGINE